MQDTDLVERIIGLARQVTARPLVLDADTRFRLSGLDSLALVNLATRCEDVFGIEFEPEDLTNTAIDMPRQLAELLRVKYGQGQAS